MIEYEYDGSCLAFKIAEAGIESDDQPDVCPVTWKGPKQPLKRCLNMCEEGPLAASVSLSAAQ